jgi:hypothetical protein
MSEFGPLKATFDANVAVGFANNDIYIQPNLFVEGSVNQNDDCFSAAIKRRSIFGSQDSDTGDDKQNITVNELFQEDGALTIVATKKIAMDEESNASVQFIFNGEDDAQKSSRDKLYVCENHVSENFAVKMNIPAGECSLDLHIGSNQCPTNSKYATNGLEYAVMLNGKNDSCEGDFSVGLVSKATDTESHKRRLVGSTSLSAEGNCYHVEGGFDTTQMGKAWNINVNNTTEVDGNKYKLGLQLLERGNKGKQCAASNPSPPTVDACETDVEINGEIEMSSRTANDCECYYRACLRREDQLTGAADTNDVVTTLEMGVRKTYEKVDFAALA